jgi:nucleoside 2-deoxyribosyltransferase
MNYLKGKSVYISSPIECRGSDDWRNPLKKVLTEQFELDVFDPFCDPKQNREYEIVRARQDKDYEKIRAIAKDFVRKDLAKVDRADMLLAYVPYKVPTVGTCHEIINANNSKKPVFLVTDGDKSKISFWYYGFIHYNFMFSNWQELYNMLEEINSGSQKHNNRFAYVYGLI